MEKAQKPYKIVFLKLSSKNVKTQKWISKDCLTLFVSGREKTRVFVHTICFGQTINSWPKTVQTRKHYKNSGFSGNLLKTKNDTFFQKRCFFDMGEKVGFTNCVFEKLCFFFF